MRDPLRTGGELADGGGRAVYATLDGTRWFALPHGLAPVAEHEDGDGLVVRGMLGQRRRLDPALVAAYEVTPEEGKDLARVELLGWLGSAGHGLRAISGLLAARGKDPAALAPLERVIGAVEQALRRPTDPPPAPDPGAAGPPLEERFEAWVRRALEDPREVEKLRQLASDIQGAADALKARGRG